MTRLTAMPTAPYPSPGPLPFFLAYRIALPMRGTRRRAS
jgi:hypothetical protein